MFESTAPTESAVPDHPHRELRLPLSSFSTSGSAA
jgi:hypothetical protein